MPTEFWTGIGWALVITIGIVLVALSVGVIW